MSPKLLIPLTAAAVASCVVLFGGVLRESPSAGATQLPADRTIGAFEPSYSSAQNAAALVLRLQERLRAQPDDVSANALLGLAYQQRARETGDPAYYPKAEAVLVRARQLDGNDPVALSGLASLALTRHEFHLALQLAREARTLAPSSARNLGAIGDALVELGRYREAFAAFDEMARLKPSVAAYARVSYARELGGDVAGARAAMRLAAESAVPGSEAAAWTAVQLGKLLFSTGSYAHAEREYRLALAHRPGYAAAFDALAHVEAAHGRIRRAIALERRAATTVPLPQYVATLGDLLARAGLPAAAAQQYRLVAAIDRLQRASGMRTDLEFALFKADHGFDLPGALRRARVAHHDRPSIDGDDVLAWALARNGRCAEALPYARRALRLGTRDALKLFHRGMIERCLGRPAVARNWFRRAVVLNPGFSPLWSPLAARYAR
jgi:tetratricopeptide (TPR) repeat protein